MFELLYQTNINKVAENFHHREPTAMFGTRKVVEQAESHRRAKCTQVIRIRGGTEREIRVELTKFMTGSAMGMDEISITSNQPR